MKLGGFLVLLVTGLLVSSSSISAQENAPVGAPTDLHKDDNWWRVKVELKHSGFSRSGACEEMYPEYLVKIESGTPVVYGINGDDQVEIVCPAVESQLLDSGPEKRGFLKFPMEIGMEPWSFTYLRSSPGVRSKWVTAKSKVVAFGKIKLLKEEELRTIQIEESAKEILRKRIEELGKIGELDAFKIERWINIELSETYYYAPAPKAGMIVLFERTTKLVQRTVTVIDYHLNQ